MANDPSGLEECLDFSPLNVWKRSPLSKDAVDRIYRSPRLALPLDGDVMEAWRLTLALFASHAVDLEACRRRATPDERNNVLNALAQLQDAISILEYTDGLAPEVPEAYVQEIEQWKRAAFAKKAPRGAHVIPSLLVVFAAVFRKRPSDSISGPTSRFVTSFLGEMHLVMSTAQFALPPKHSDRAPKISTLFQVPTAETLKTQIKRNMPDSAAKALVEDMFWTMYRRVCGKVIPPASPRFIDQRRPSLD